MRVVVTGATGFVGRHLVSSLLEHGHEVTAVARNCERAKTLLWYDRVRFVPIEIKQLTTDVRKHLQDCDTLIHLAWPGLPNYRGLFHFEENLPEAYGFLKAIALAGFTQIMVVGTCFEYGMQQGCLKEDLVPIPSNPYGLAKETLRRFLEELQSEISFVLQWCRLFYMYGEGQNPRSVLAQLDHAILRGDHVFPMSSGEQIRDYLPVIEVARRLTKLVEIPSATGIFNICSGEPISIRRLVESRIQSQGASIKLELGAYPYPDYEPFAFWGDPAKYLSIK